MAEQNKRLSDQEVQNLQERMNKLAMDKSYFQLVMQMITRISATPGLDNVINSLLVNTMEILGGSNLQLYYNIDEKLFFADAMGAQKTVQEIEDEVVARVYKTGWAEEVEGVFEDTLLKTPDFTKAYTWVYPLKIGHEVIAVLRMENLHINMRQLYEQLPAYFNFAALVLKNEILGESKLREINLQLEGEVSTRKKTEEALRFAKASLEKTVDERTAELKESNTALSRELHERQRVMDELDQFFNVSVDLLGITDRNGIIHRMNRAWTDTFGYPIHELDGSSLLGLVHPDEHDEVVAALEKAGKEGETCQFTGRIRHKDGSYRWIEWNAASTEELLYIAARDITEKREAEEEIRRFNTELEQLVEERTGELNETNKRLESFNEIMAEREMRVVEIKQEVNLLNQQLGKQPPYKEIWNALKEK